MRTSADRVCASWSGWHAKCSALRDCGAIEPNPTRQPDVERERSSNIYVIVMLATLAGPAPRIVEFLQSLSPGTVVAQLEDGTIAVCEDVEEADRRILESRDAMLRLSMNRGTFPFTY